MGAVRLHCTCWSRASIGVFSIPSLCFVLLIGHLQNPCIRNCSILAVHFLIILISSCYPALLIHYSFIRMLPLAPSVAREYYWPMISINTLSFKFIRALEYHNILFISFPSCGSSIFFLYTLHDYPLPYFLSNLHFRHRLVILLFYFLYSCGTILE